MIGNLRRLERWKERGFQIRYLLTHPEFARTIGTNGCEHVKENFLMTTNVKRWLLLFRTLEEARAKHGKAS